MTADITINKYERDGVFVVMCEGQSQSPIIIETEGGNSSYEGALATQKRISWSHRTCICRVIPVRGNELLPLDMQRMQK